VGLSSSAAVKSEPEGEPAPVATLPEPRIGRRAGTVSRVLVLNASYEPINVCTVRRAAVLVLKDRAEILEHADRALHAEHFALPRPAVIRLTSYVRIPRDAHARRITRRAVFARDRWTCQYCGTVRSTLTVDHVIPRSKGGASSWDNIVASCAPCNRRKGDRLPTQIDMHPRQRPRAPSPNVFVHVATPTIPSAWEQYLAA
jgi:5-methylcytosine-specific restriction endonuclease McrA